ncbi:hypothetical protein KBX06_03210 [Micromonospora sp. C31]|uniref:efflux RND transporter periplasmic adaptor subunit n=1 Tax=Micromonospora sp. C31 TaxID=2824876 RepID=UPI001B373396|nr:hypothetical protein [Micromonospora sp. C31]MBQ1072178.1 hypothetical protein [Micromonospora sp. C31]
MTSEAVPETSMRRRRLLLTTVSTASALLITLGFFGAKYVKSPAEQRANAAPPQATLLTAEVERRVLTRTLVVRGTVTAAQRIEVTPVVLGTLAQVLTRVNVTPGEKVAAGDVLLAVSGRPLIVFPGKVPGYRDLKPGDHGEDVRQLQVAMRSLGHYHNGDRAGFFGARTKAAVRSLYAEIGYDVPDTGGPGGAGDEEALLAASEAVEGSRIELDAVRRRIAAGQKVAAAEEPLSQQRRRLEAGLRRATERHRDLVARTGPMVPMAEFIFIPNLPARVVDVPTTVGNAVTAPLITLATGQLKVSLKLRPDEAALLRPGMTAQVISETLGEETRGTVTSVGRLTPSTAESGGGSPYHPVELRPARPLSASWADLDVRVTITAAQTETPVLLVPLSAISAGAGGQAAVSVRGPSGEIQRVEVRAGVSGDGFVAITPLKAPVSEGDRVVVSGQP